MAFKSAYNTGTKDMPCTPSGTKIVYEHREDIDKQGKRSLIRDRAVNIYEKIQASKESCLIENILRKCAEGDYTVLQQVNGQYLDITDAPSTLAEAQQFVIRVNAEFDKLPKEIKAKFNNNAEEYVAQFGTETWAEKTGMTALWEERQAKEEAAKVNEANMAKAFENLAKEGAVTNE